VAARRPASGPARGGELVPSLRTSLTALSVAFVAGAGALAALGADRFRPTVELLGLLGILLLVPALVFRRAAFVGPALAFVGAAYGVSVSGRGHGADQLVVLFAPLLLVGAELGYWSTESPPSVREEPALVLRRLASVVAVAGLAAAIAAFLLASSELDVGGGLALLAAGVAAATGVLALVARLARRGADAS
jgi:hypothetical protein